MISWKENNLSYETYYELRDSVGWSNFCKEQAMVALSNSRYSVVMIDNDHAIAMGRLVGDGLYYTIVDVIVTPHYQGKEIGTCILDKILNYINTTTPCGGRVSIQLIAEKGKEDFYEKLGFKRIPHEFCGSGMRKVLYKKEDKMKSELVKLQAKRRAK